MTKRVYTKIGDVFFVVIDNSYKAYFQFIGIDQSNMNTDTIRVFKRKYPLYYEPTIDEVVNDEVLFYSHTILRRGIEVESWKKAGKSTELGLDGLSQIWFGNTVNAIYDSATMDCTSIDPLENWLLWKYNKSVMESFVPTRDIVPHIEPGGIYPYQWINERIKFGYFLNNEDMYDIIKRKPREDVDSFMKRIYRRNTFYYHFVGENLVRIISLQPDINYVKVKISSNSKYYGLKLWEINWKAYHFINKRDFESIWDTVKD